MNWVVLASDEMGFEILKVFKEQGLIVQALVLEPADRGACNQPMEGLGTHEQIRFIGPTWGAEDISWIHGLGADWLFLDWWPYIVPEEVLSAPRLGALNMHPSLLPHGAGRNPNFWALLEGTPFGVTIHHATPRIDGGEIAFQKTVPLDWTDTGGSAYAKARAACLELVRAALPLIEQGQVPRLPQDPRGRKYHPSGAMEAASKIDLDGLQSSRELLNLLRARTFPPHPAAWFEEDGHRYEVRIDIREVP